MKEWNNSPWVNFTPCRKNAPSHTWVIFHQLKLASLHAYTICNLKWKVRSGIKSVHYLLTGAHKTIRIHQQLHSQNEIMKITQFKLILIQWPRKNRPPHVELFPIFYFKNVVKSEYISDFNQQNME